MNPTDTLNPPTGTIPLERIDAYRWRIPQNAQPGMLVPGLVFADEALLEEIKEERALQQVVNVATLPGIVGASPGMPDIHWGYGFPVGGVAATNRECGVVTPGGIGFDINCGVRLLATDLLHAQIWGERLGDLANALFARLPSGVGGAGIQAVSHEELRAIMVRVATCSTHSSLMLSRKGM